MKIDYSVVIADASRLDDVAPLFKSMVEHHRMVAADQWPVRDADEAWHRRRRQYEAWLSGGNAWLLLALHQAARRPAAAGYAMVRVTEPGPTWDLGEKFGVLESMAVAADARGAGIGTRLVHAARELVRAQGAAYWSVSLAAANAGALRLYERHGFRPFYLDLVARL